jgi:lysozyme
MNITGEGLALIKRFEGFRPKAYRCPAGRWTIGYGHTGQAGAPEVKPGMRLSRQEASAILARDVERFAAGVRQALKVTLTDRQFSALVSFAYNVGLSAFRSSSVLKAVNAGDLDAVPRRLGLWVKADGRVLPGLVKRRAAEAELFADGGDANAPRAPVEPVGGKPGHRSTTNLAAILSAVAGTVSALAASFKDMTGAAGGPAVSLALVAVVVAASLWIVRERIIKSREEGI